MSEKANTKRGGARAGAGRKKGSSAYGESTRAIRVPESMLPELKAMLALRKQPPAKQQSNAVDNSARLLCPLKHLAN